MLITYIHFNETFCFGEYLISANGSVVDIMCGMDGCTTHGLENKACAPIPINRMDSDYGKMQDCLQFVRSQMVVGLDCKPGQ